jgi:diguanylate cyclase (GGDEF)-like protein
MKLRYRILFCISLTLVVLVLGVYGFSSRRLMQSYSQLEHQDAEQNTDRAKRAFLDLDGGLHDKSIDWADWDDTYQFMADHNKAYIKSNLVSESVVSMKLDVILFVDIHGKLFHQFTLKRFPELPVPDPVQLWHSLHLDRPDLSAFRTRKDYSGVILHPNSPLLISVRPIFTSKGTGPQRGWLVFGRYFDKRQLQHLAEQTRLDVQTFRVDAPSIPRADRQILAALSTRMPMQIRPKNSRTILGYALLLDVQNNPALLLKITLPRHIYQQGLASTGYLVRLIFFAALAFGGIMLLVMEFSVLSRLTKLTRQVEQIGEEGPTAKRVVLSGRDELASLAGQINGMLLKLERTTDTLHKSQEELRHQNENLEAIVEERTQELFHQAFHDPLTGLPNRAQVLHHLELIADRQKEGGKAVLFLDLDNFKFINDSLGHSAGDELLIAVAKRLKKCVRPEDMVARLGGDEFLIIIEAAENVEAVIQVAERVLDVMNVGFSLSAGEGFTSSSIGIVYTETGSVEPDILIRDADTAMYQAKSGGKAAYAVFEPGMNDRLTERVEMEVGLRLAVEQQQFCVHYQPLIDLNTGHLTGVEALVRWQHPEKGLIAPGKFIPIAEETGLIVPLGYWVLEEACQQTVVWKQAFPNHGPFTTNVNLSGKQLQKPDVVERVREVLEKTGLPAEYLKIEITESVMMDDVEGAIAKLAALRSLGVKLALDDFGTGYSSMASLSSFPLDTVKIDRAFIARLDTHPDAESIVAAIIMLAKSLNMDVTGEGIENPEQVSRLQGLGCDVGQGYFFSRPVNAEAMEEKMMQADNLFVKNYTQMDRALIERLLAESDSTIEANLKAA